MTTAREVIAEIQSSLGVDPDGIWGKKSQAALDSLIKSPSPLSASAPLRDNSSAAWRKVKASTFADPADVRAFEQCKREGGYMSKGVWHPGGSDQHCFAIGDNGIGKWGHKTAQVFTPMAAIPRDVWSHDGKTGGDWLEVRIGRQIVRGILGDTLPSTENIHNGAGIDLNPAFAKAFGLAPPFMVEAEWRWA